MARCDNTKSYLEYLQNVDNSQDLTRFEEFILDEIDGAYKEYETLAFKACLNFRLTLTRLIVPYCDNRLYEIDGESGGTIHFLYTFNKLKYLKIINKHNLNLTMFNIPAILSNLMNLHFISSFYVPIELTIPPTFSCINLWNWNCPTYPSIVLNILHLASLPAWILRKSIEVVFALMLVLTNWWISSFTICCSIKSNKWIQIHNVEKCTATSIRAIGKYKNHQFLSVFKQPYWRSRVVGLHIRIRRIWTRNNSYWNN